MDDALIASLSNAVEAAPTDVPLRLHLAELLLGAGRNSEALAHLGTALSHQPDSAEAQRLMAKALAPSAPETPAEPAEPGGPSTPGEFDWTAAESELGDVVPPMFADDDAAQPTSSAYDVEDAGVRLADVGGLVDVKKRLEVSFLTPLRNPELRKLYGKSLRGGLMLYGPPGCGKTFLAKAVAGELGARFLQVSLADILDMFVGQSERNVHELFEVARASSPCVLFLDEIDALGQKRTQTRNSGTRNTVNQLLTEMDGVSSDNDGVYVLAATNAPWDVDPALRRPGRLDRTLLVLPPDREARDHILRTHLKGRPIERIDTAALAKRTEGFSGADLAHLCDAASELALMDSAASGRVRMITMADFDQPLREIRPSIGPWLETARNVVMFANNDGEYDELGRYLRKHKGGR